MATQNNNGNAMLTDVDFYSTNVLSGSRVPENVTKDLIKSVTKCQIRSITKDNITIRVSITKNDMFFHNATHITLKDYSGSVLLKIDGYNFISQAAVELTVSVDWVTYMSNDVGGYSLTLSGTKLRTIHLTDEITSAPTLETVKRYYSMGNSTQSNLVLYLKITAKESNMDKTFMSGMVYENGNNYGSTLGNAPTLGKVIFRDINISSIQDLVETFKEIATDYDSVGNVVEAWLSSYEQYSTGTTTFAGSTWQVAKSTPRTIQRVTVKFSGTITDPRFQGGGLTLSYGEGSATVPYTDLLSYDNGAHYKYGADDKYLKIVRVPSNNSSNGKIVIYLDDSPADTVGGGDGGLQILATIPDPNIPFPILNSDNGNYFAQNKWTELMEITSAIVTAIAATGAGSNPNIKNAVIEQMINLATGGLYKAAVIADRLHQPLTHLGSSGDILLKSKNIMLSLDEVPLGTGILQFDDPIVLANRQRLLDSPASCRIKVSNVSVKSSEFSYRDVDGPYYIEGNFDVKLSSGSTSNVYSPPTVRVEAQQAFLNGVTIGDG